MPVEAILETILQEANAGVGSLMIHDPRSRSLRIVAAKGFPQDVIEDVKKLSLAPGEGIAGHVFQTGKPYFLHSAEEDSLFASKGLPTRIQSQFLSLPLQAGGATIGVLNIHFPSAKLMNSSELEALHRMASRMIAHEMTRPASRPSESPAATC